MSYDFAADDAYSVAFGFKTYHFECPVDSGQASTQEKKDTTSKSKTTLASKELS